jgi:hypothetical protein
VHNGEDDYAETETENQPENETDHVPQAPHEFATQRLRFERYGRMLWAYEGFGAVIGSAIL